MAYDNTVFEINNEIKEVEREIKVIEDLTVDKDSGSFCASTEVKITSGELEKIQLRLYDFLTVLKSAKAELPFPCRNGK